ncbi:MAG: hypothetical protein ACFFDN_08665 [Candidatus Hodarchaeota archaeon]
MVEDSVANLERAKKLVRDTYREEIKLGLRHISKIIQKETFGLGSPIDLAFRLGVAPDIRKNVFKQIDLILDNAIKLDTNSDIDILTNGNFNYYMKYDLTISYLRKRHEAFIEIKEIVKEIFRHRIVVAQQLLNAHNKGNFETYEDLARLALPNRKDAEKALDDEIDLSNKVINIVKKNPDIIFAPVILQDFGLIIVEQLMNYGNNRKKSNLDKIYDNNGGN